MTQQATDRGLSRRGMIAAAGIGALTLPVLVRAQAPAAHPPGPPSTITTPPRDFGPHGAPTTYFTDPDVISVDPAFNALVQPNAGIMRLWTGALWGEGPAWNAEGRYFIWSDIPNNRQLRWLEPRSLEPGIGITDNSVAVRHGKNLQRMIIALDHPLSDRHKRNVALYPFGDHRIHQDLRVIRRAAKP